MKTSGKRRNVSGVQSFKIGREAAEKGSNNDYRALGEAQS
jgi:hypothetical protein